MDERRDTTARDDGAVFAPTQIRSPRRPPILAAVVAVTIGALALVGAFEGLGGDASTAAAPTAAAAAVPEVMRTPRPARTRPPGPVPPPTAQTDILELALRPAGSHLFVHGDVSSLNVIVVTVSIADAAGHVSEVQSVKLQSGVTVMSNGANLRFNARFDVRFDVPDEVMGEGLWVLADAYDFRGRIIESLRQPVIQAPLEAFGGAARSDGAT